MKLITENHKIEWLAYLDDCEGMKGAVCSGKTEMEAIDELMISLKVKLLYDRDKLLKQ